MTTTASTARFPSHQEGRFWTPRRISYAVFLACLGALLLLHFSFMKANGTTVDEFIHLQAGYRYWQCGDFSANPEHPPLIKWVAAFPIRKWSVGEFSTECGRKIADADGLTAYFVSQSPNANELLWKARRILVVFPILLLTSVFFAVRSWYGDAAASIAAILITLEPTLVAHSSLVTSDAAVTVFTFATVWCGIEVVRKQSIVYELGLPICLGLALASKHSAAVLPIILLAVMAVTYVSTPLVSRRRAVTLAALWLATCAIAVLILWALYGFRYQALPYSDSPPIPLTALMHDAGMDRSLVSTLVQTCAKYHLLPESYLKGIVHIVTNGSRPAFVWGRLYNAGVWFYFPVAVVVKTTAGVLLLVAVSLWFQYRDWRSSDRITVPLLGAMVLLLGVAMAGKLNIGVRHVLPVLVLAVVLASASAAAMFRRGGKARVIACVLIAVSVLSAARVVPYQLSYANEFFGGPDRLHYVLADSNLDWGQSNAELEKVLTEVATHGPCAVAPGNLASVMSVHKARNSCVLLPTDSGVETISDRLSPVVDDHWNGTVVLQPLVLASTSAYLPFMNRRPDEIRGQGTILIYRGAFDFNEIAALRRFHRGSYLMQVARKSWPSPESRAAAALASKEFAEAEVHCPEANRVELEIAYMASLTAQERWTEARYHADQVLRLAGDSPTYRRERQLVLDALGLAK